MKKILSHSLLIPWIFFVISLYWIVTVGPGYYESADKYLWVANARIIAMAWFYRE